MKYEFDILAAMLEIEKPTTRKIVELTGISERKVQGVIKSLCDDLEMNISRIKEGRTIYFMITGWGVFETGLKLKKKLKSRNENKRKLTGSYKAIYTFTQKRKYFDKVKLVNFKESMRLEGIAINITKYPVKKNEITSMRNDLIKKYKMLSSVNG